MNIELTNQEKVFLKEFAEKQHDGAKDNQGTMTPIHVVERIRKEYVESDGDVWLWRNEDESKAFDSFCQMLEYARNAGNKNYPPYNVVVYETVNDVFIEDEESYCEAYRIKAYPCKEIQYTEPVAFFFIRDEAVRYKDGYQAHNCADCRIYTYGLGYSNKGDMPVFRELLMRMGERLRDEEASENGDRHE